MKRETRVRIVKSSSRNLLQGMEERTERFMSQVQWVRCLKLGQRIVGVGFWDGKLAYVDANELCAPDVTQISLRQSAEILRDFLKVEQVLGPVIDVNEDGWGKWLGMVSTICP